MKFPKMHRDDWNSVKLTLKDIDQIRDLHNNGYSNSYLAEMFNVTWSTIRRWVDEEFRQYMLEYNQEYRKKCLESEKFREYLATIQKTRMKYAKNYKLVKIYTHYSNLTKNLSKEQHARKLETSAKYRLENPSIVSRWFDKPDNIKSMRVLSKRLERAKTFSAFRMFMDNLK